MKRLALALAVAAGCLGCGDDDPEILDCTGTCSCVPEENSCTCQGGSTCEVTGGDGAVTLVCEGNAECDLSCGPDCHVVCQGTSGCAAEIGDGADAICNGTGTCDYTCLGDCTVDCPGTSACLVSCAAGATCSITSCGNGVEDCGDGVQACRTDCPAP